MIQDHGYCSLPSVMMSHLLLHDTYLLTLSIKDVRASTAAGPELQFGISSVPFDACIGCIECNLMMKTMPATRLNLLTAAVSDAALVVPPNDRVVTIVMSLPSMV